MKLKELFEEQQTLVDALKECRSYLNKPGAKQGFLYRGIDLPDSEYTLEMLDVGLPGGGSPMRWKILERRLNRRAVATKQEFSDAADEVLKRKFGWNPRADGVFVTGSQSESGSYGDPHIVIPMGPTHFVWSPDIEDLYVALKSHRGITADGVARIIDETTYTDDDLAKAIRSQCEIMLDCDSYIIVNVRDKHTAGFIRDELRKLTGIDA